MRLSLTIALLSLGLACDPPPKISVEDTNATVDTTPRVSLLFPQTSTELIYCSSFMAVVDVDNYELYPDPYEPGLEAVEGQGHWHFNIPAGLGGGTIVTGQPYAFVDVSEQDPDPDTLYLFEAVLVDNLHTPIPGISSAVAEIRIDDSFMVDGDSGMVPGCLGGGSGSNADY